MDSLTSRADEIQAEMAGREKSIKTWKSAIEEETVLLKAKEDERASYLKSTKNWRTKERVGRGKRRSQS